MHKFLIMKILLCWIQAALVSLLVLIFVGAIVRATGSGLGCPDWPKCWGCLIPPTSVEQVDFDLIDLDRFKAKAERAGRNPDEITRETLHKEFNPFHTWVEFVNRLFALPMLLTSLVGFIISCCLNRSGVTIRWMMGLSVFTVLLNAWLGARVVYSGLKPGTITTHLALAYLLMIFLIVAIVHTQKTLGMVKLRASKGAFWAAFGIMIFLIIEGLMGAQLREITDELAKEHYGAVRSDWTEELKQKSVYYAHRTFSWSVLVLVGLFMWLLKKSRGYYTLMEGSMIFMVFALMVMGIILGHIGILPWVQVLHVGVASILFCTVTYWVVVYFTLPEEDWDTENTESKNIA